MPAPIYLTKPLITTCTNGLSKNRRDEGTTTGQNGASIPQLAAISSYVVCLRFCIHIKSVCVCVCVRVCVPIALLFLVKLNVHIYSANLKYDKSMEQLLVKLIHFLGMIHDQHSWQFSEKSNRINE